MLVTGNDDKFLDQAEVPTPVPVGTQVACRNTVQKHNFMTSGEGCTRPSAQGVAKANFLLCRLSSSHV